MHTRIKDPAMSLPGAFDALQAVHKVIENADVPRATLELMNLRASQINGCGVCVDMHSRGLRKLGEKAEAKSEYVQLMRDYPESPLVHGAIKRIAWLNGGNFSKDAEEVWKALSTDVPRLLQTLAPLAPKPRG